MAFSCLQRAIQICVISGFAVCPYLLIRCAAIQEIESDSSNAVPSDPFVLVLGIAQDGGYPQAGCRLACCQRAWKDPTQARHVVSLAIVDPETGQRWLIECTPDFKQQLHALNQQFPSEDALGISGVFLTHAHIGHYAGLINFGREVLGAKGIPTFVMPRMKNYLETNGPWNQLIELGNLKLHTLQADQPVELTDRIKIIPITVPHRDEFSETVAFRIEGPNRRVLFLPDIDKWDRWERKVEDELSFVDVAFLDATFFDAAELPGRDMREIPHPFATESLARFAGLSDEDRAKIHFIHFNHTNPLMDPESAESRQVEAAGLRLACQGARVAL
jgi:pyrroloquinoline quinone biosynthesis protein B